MKCAIQLIENEKRDIEVIMVMQKDKYEKRETELLATIQVSTSINLCTISDFFYYFVIFIGNERRIKF